MDASSLSSPAIIATCETSSRLVVTRTVTALSKPPSIARSGRSTPQGSGGTIVLSSRLTLALWSMGGSLSPPDRAFAGDDLAAPCRPPEPIPFDPPPLPPRNMLLTLWRGVSPFRDAPLPPPEAPPPFSLTIPLTLATSPLFLTYLSTALSKKLMSASPLPYSLLVTKSSNIWLPTNSSENSRTSPRCAAKNSWLRNPAPPYAPSLCFEGKTRNLRYF
mmetsp:Transcript_27713/g.66754  ORF Transcript_27713/g.66754 Transcript_27713/m.66754 type:complete len:218 (-) Transcript_27713:990-1643(-)